ncbi:MAG: glutaredoxin family protein [Lachnospirales bacterium]
MKTTNSNSQPIKIYTLPDCSYCKQTKLYLDKNNYTYEEIDLNTNKAGQSFMSERNYSKLPVTVIGETEIHGFRLDLIKETLNNI